MKSELEKLFEQIEFDASRIPTDYSDNVEDNSLKLDDSGISVGEIHARYKEKVHPILDMIMGDSREIFQIRNPEYIKLKTYGQCEDEGLLKQFEKWKNKWNHFNQFVHDTIKKYVENNKEKFKDFLENEDWLYEAKSKVQLKNLKTGEKQIVSVDAVWNGGGWTVYRMNRDHGIWKAAKIDGKWIIINTINDIYPKYIWEVINTSK